MLVTLEGCPDPSAVQLHHRCKLSRLQPLQVLDGLRRPRGDRAGPPRRGHHCGVRGVEALLQHDQVFGDLFFGHSTEDRRRLGRVSEPGRGVNEYLDICFILVNTRKGGGALGG